jgi:hypothetical protein
MINVMVSRDVEVSADKVYAAVADFGSVDWMNGVTKVVVEGDGPGMVRNIYFSEEAPPVKEQMTFRDDDSKQIGYLISEGNPLPVDQYNATVTVVPTDSGCRVEWAGSFEAKGTDDATARTSVEGMYGVLIGWLLAGL